MSRRKDRAPVRETPPAPRTPHTPPPAAPRGQSGAAPTEARATRARGAAAAERKTTEPAGRHGSGAAASPARAPQRAKSCRARWQRMSLRMGMVRRTGWRSRTLMNAWW